MAGHMRNRYKKKVLRILIGLLVVVSVALGGFFITRGFDKSTGNNTEDSEYQLPARTLNYDGVTYKQRRKVHAYLFIGVDTEGEAEDTNSYIGGGQGDAQMLLVVDDLNRTWQILQLNRDTMTNVPVLGVLGDVVSYEYTQLCMAHSFGDGKEESCENNVNTVSSLLKGQEIEGYAALNMSAMGILNNIAGGVKVNVTSDFTLIDPTLVTGEDITLTDEQALTFVRSRKDVDDNTNTARMVRQKEFMSGFLKQIEDADYRLVKDSYERLDRYLTTNITESEMVKIFNKIKKFKEKEVLNIDGEAKVIDDHWAYYLNEDSLMNTVVTLFYEKED